MKSGDASMQQSNQTGQQKLHQADRFGQGEFSPLLFAWNGKNCAIATSTQDRRHRQAGQGRVKLRSDTFCPTKTAKSIKSASPSQFWNYRALQ
jgi:hypothetical protein